MNILRIAWKFIYQSIKKPIGLVLLILGPVVLMLILGQAFAGIFSAGQAGPDINIGYYSGEKGVLYKGFQSFINQLDNFNITCEETESISEGEDKTRQAGYKGFVIIDEKNKCLELVLNNNSGVHAGIIEGILNGFITRFNFVDLVLRYKPEALDSVLRTEEVNYVSHSALNASRQPRAIDYFGITILTMGVLFGAFMGSYGVSREKALRTLYRIYTAPISKIEVFLGICSGTLCILLLQFAAVFLIGKYVLNIYYGENIAAVIILVLSESFFALALGIGITSLVENTKAANGILNGIIPFLIFLGGGYSRLPDTEVFNILSSFSPIGWVNKALFEIIYNTGNARFIPALVFCFAAGFLLLGITAFKQVRRKTI